MDYINKTTKKDVGYATVKAALGSIPVLGSAATELFGLIIAPPLDKRRQQWMNEVADRLKELEQKNEVNFAALGENEQFVDTILQASQFALKTSENEKIAAFKNAVINTAIGETPDKSKSQIFLNLVDRFTIWHLKILAYFDSPTEWFKKAGKQPTALIGGSMLSGLRAAYPVLQGQDAFVDVIWGDLKNAGFHNSSDLKTMMTGDGIYADRTTTLGKEFLEFISEH